MRLLILLYCLLLLSLVFEFVPADLPARDWWPFFSDYQLTPEWYIHEIQVHITEVVLCFVLAYEARFYRNEIAVFAWLQVLDFADFLLTNNTPWFSLGIMHVSMNSISFVIFGLCLWNAYDGRS